MKVLIPGYKYQLEYQQGGYAILQFGGEIHEDGRMIAKVHNGTSDSEVIGALINRIMFLDQKLANEHLRKALEYLLSANARLNMHKTAVEEGRA